ncbi:DNA/RNA helicase domain-containing protein [Kitasatospora sp. NPDC087315]|uniref:DNA/RNA helicase domain-containing protein n=1 Tax=Kitasatospora sp. NPDC087315 TaxID=3364069 RepID=UPI00382CCD15
METTTPSQQPGPDLSGPPSTGGTKPRRHGPWAAAGSVAELASAAQRPEFIAACWARYAEAGFGTPGEGELRSWRASWAPLLEALGHAGLGDFRLYLEYGTPGAAQRLDALLLGTRGPGKLVAVVIELKQWQDCEVIDAVRVRRSDGQVVVHPVQQTAAYTAFLRDWFPEGDMTLDVHGVVLLHGGTAEAGRRLTIGQGPGASIPVLTKADLDATPQVLARRLHCAGVSAPAPEQSSAFEKTPWAPSASLLEGLAEALAGQARFTMVGDQQTAFLRTRVEVDQALDTKGRRPGAVIAVSGGPGSGKTALAVRILGHLMRRENVDVRYVTPSGTLLTQLREVAGEAGLFSGRDVFILPGKVRSLSSKRIRIVVVDEAQRLTRGPHGGTSPDLQWMARNVDVLVVFLDERQVIRPREGVTVGELRHLAEQSGRDFQPLTLAGSFRNAGSRAFTGWIDDLFYGRPRPWNDQDYEVAVASDPFDLESWIRRNNTSSTNARIAAGFCWDWSEGGVLAEDVQIRVPSPGGTHDRIWSAAWNSRTAVLGEDGSAVAPVRQLWANGAGGHRQVGCVYTAQGLEYEYAGLIIGDDLVRRGNRWHGRPQASHDSAMRGVDAAEYLPLALNTYRVLATRGTKALRLYSTDEETQHFLVRLMGTAALD